MKEIQQLCFAIALGVPFVAVRSNIPKIEDLIADAGSFIRSIFRFLGVDDARVGHIISTLRKYARQHMLVVEIDGMTHQHMIRGLFSTSQISKLVGTTKPTIQSIRERTHWNISNIQPVDPVALGPDVDPTATLEPNADLGPAPEASDPGTIGPAPEDSGEE